MSQIIKNRTRKKEMLPDIYIFNPTCEMAIANGTKAWQPNKMLCRFEEDLALLPAYMAKKTDWVIVKKLPSDFFIKQLRKQGFQLPQLLLVADMLSKETVDTPKGKLNPWGWSPALYHKFKEWGDSFCEQFKKSVMRNWNPIFKELYSRETALRALSLLDEQFPELQINCFLPKVCSSEQEINTQLDIHHNIILKAPWSSSGRGIQTLSGKIDRSVLQWSKGVLRQQKALMVEPLLNKSLDYAYQFEVKNRKATFLDKSWFFTDKKGKYQGNWLSCPKYIVDSDEYALIKSYDEKIIPALSSILTEIFGNSYEGYLGVDAMVFRNKRGVLSLHPCVEINVRCNMGILAMELDKQFGSEFNAMRIVRKGFELESDYEVIKKIDLTEQTPESQFYAELVKFDLEE